MNQILPGNGIRDRSKHFGTLSSIGFVGVWSDGTLATTAQVWGFEHMGSVE